MIWVSNIDRVYVCEWLDADRLEMVIRVTSRVQDCMAAWLGEEVISFVFFSLSTSEKEQVKE